MAQLHLLGLHHVPRANQRESTIPDIPAAMKLLELAREKQHEEAGWVLDKLAGKKPPKEKLELKIRKFLRDCFANDDSERAAGYFALLCDFRVVPPAEVLPKLERGAKNGDKLCALAFATVAENATRVERLRVAAEMGSSPAMVCFPSFGVCILNNA